ncbi:MAG: hypothetical protein WA990_13415 [Rubrobacteraceae bacterium]
MSLQAISQISAPLSNVLLGLVFAVGYYIMIKMYRETINEMKEERLSAGRPQVIVQADYKRLPEVELVVRNVSSGAARDIQFDFSHDIASSDGYVVTNLPYFKYGLDFLEPEGEISCYWDSLEEIIPRFKEQGLDAGITVTTSYKSLSGTPYTSSWKVNPLLFEGYRDSPRKGIEDLAGAVEKISAELQEIRGPREGRERENA